MDNQSPRLQDAEIQKTSWTLLAFETAGWQATTWGPLQLTYGENKFFGNDGCRDFDGQYEAKNDSIFPKLDHSLPPLLCTMVTTPVEPLFEPYRMWISGDELRIFARDDVVYTFKSATTESAVKHRTRK